MRLNLSLKLLLTTLLCISVSLGGWGIVLYQQGSHLLDRQLQHALNSSLQLVSGNMQQDMTHIEQLAATLAQSPSVVQALQNEDGRQQIAMLNRLTANYGKANYLMLIDRHLEIFAINTRNEFDQPLPSLDLLGRSMTDFVQTDLQQINTPKWFAQQLDPLQAPLQLPANLSQWLVVPVFYGPHKVGWLVISFKFYQHAQGHLDELLRVYEHQGYQPISGQLFEQNNAWLVKQGSYSREAQNIAHSFWLRESQVTLNVQFEQQLALAAITNNHFLLYLLAALGLVLVGFLYLVFSRLFVLPIKKMQLMAKEIEGGNYRYQNRVQRHDELGELGRLMQQLGEHMAATTEELSEIANNHTQLANQAHQLLHNIVQSAGDAILTIDQYGRITMFNQAAERMFGYSAKQMLGQSLKSLMPFEVAEQHQSFVQRLLQTGEAHILGSSQHFTAKRANGEEFPINLVVSQVAGAAEPMFSGVIRDITELKRSEANLIAAKDMAERSASYKSQFLASMSHEIRTPMNGILGMLELLQFSELNNEQRHHAMLARTSAESLLTIIDDILDFSKVEAGKLVLDHQAFNVIDEMSLLIETMANKAQQKGLMLVLDTSRIASANVIGDAGRLRQILTNLISNAIKFTERRDIAVIAKTVLLDGEQRLLVRVRDTGIGMPKERIELVFESFSQVDASTTRKYGGTGLGLAICKQLCKLMAGGISVQSKLGQGSEFMFEIALPINPEAEQSNWQHALHQQQVLVIDSNMTAAENMRRQLQHMGAKIDVALDAKEGFEYAGKRQQDLIFIAADMQWMDGIHIAQTLKRSGTIESAKLVLIQPTMQALHAQTHLPVEFSHQMARPITLEKLLNSIDNALIDAPMLSSLAEPNLPIDDDLLQWHQYRILLVEDNPVNQTLALALLKRLGVQTELAMNGAEAIVQLSDAPFDLVLMDCQMPEMDGFEATRLIRDGRAGEQNRHITIIALTANAMSGDRERCINAGMNDYLSKPIKYFDLKDKIVAWLSLLEPSKPNK